MATRADAQMAHGILRHIKKKILQKKTSSEIKETKIEPLA